MNDIPVTPPRFHAPAFSCPHCRAYANQTWFAGAGRTHSNFYESFDQLDISKCTHCGNAAYWLDGKMTFPRVRATKPPNADLDDKIKPIYEEAADIRLDSTRGAAALLRLCVQLLCIQLGEKGNNINEDIGNLVKKGLPVEIQQALDVVRVVGNHAVHPGQIDVGDQEDTVETLFTLINMTADRMITQPKQVAGLFGALPTSIQQAIAKRDGTTSP